MMATSENESQWLQSAFIEDRMAVQMENIQDRQFLRTGVRPTAGQRVELKMFIHPSFAPTAASTNGKGDKGNGVVWFGFSGQVTRVAREPAKYFPKSHSSDTLGSKALSFFLGTKVFCLSTIDSATTKKLLPNSTFSPCLSCNEKNCKGGELFLPQQDWEELQDKVKMDLSFPINMLGGVKHGQEVVCEGRLNFDHDLHRGHEEGPWKDGIPFDGRDIWQFTVVMNDNMENKWVIKPGTFRNLGQDRQVRCWPWTNDRILPYERSGVDQDHCRFPTGEIILHLCVGPFGCQGKVHKHDFAEAA